MGVVGELSRRLRLHGGYAGKLWEQFIAVLEWWRGVRDAVHELASLYPRAQFLLEVWGVTVGLRTMKPGSL